MMIVLLLVAVISVTPRDVLGGHYKIRAPPPPPVAPANIHYGPHPPPHRPLGSPSYIHPYRSPPPSAYYPHSPSAGYHHPRIPHYYHKSTPREYHHRVASPIYQQPKLAANYVPAVAAIPAAPAIPAPAASTYGLWSNYAAFRAPVVQESFNPPPATYTAAASLIKDDDKGPIHTIPAPNLGGGPDAAHLQAAASNSLGSSFATHYHKKQDPEADLVAVLRHGIQHVNIPHSPPYQVTEDPSIHTPEKDTPLHFAPDPDPDTPTLRVPATNDPHSIPSNGQVPLDIYLQQEADKLATTESSNTLTAQDLFNLLNYQPAAPQSQSVSLYNAESLLQQAYPNAQFSPQFQTFNYDERTQQGAYGSNNFPTASMSLDLANADLSGSDNLLALKNFHDNDLAGSEKDEVYHKIVDPDNEIDPMRNDHKKKSLEKKEATVGKNELANRTPKPSITKELPQSNPKFEIRVPQDIKEKIKKDISGEKSVPCPPGTACVLPVAILPTPNTAGSNSDEGVQLQKSIQIYSTTYTTSVDDGIIPAESSTTKPSEKKARGLVMSEVTESNIDPESANSNLPFGARIRPKRY